MDLNREIVCLFLWYIVPGTSAASCENIVRLADLQDIIRNQTKVNHEQQLVIENQAKLNSELMTTVEKLNTGKMEYLPVEVFVVIYSFHN